MNKYTLVVSTIIAPGGPMFTTMLLECEADKIMEAFKRQLWEEHNGYVGCPEPSQEEIDECLDGNEIIIVYPGHLENVKGIGQVEGA